MWRHFSDSIIRRLFFTLQFIQILLNGWVRICKSQRREQEMVFMIYPSRKAFRFTYIFSSEHQLRVVYEPCCSLLFYHLTFLSYTDGIWCRWGNHLWLGIWYFVWVLFLPYSLFYVFHSCSDTSHFFLYLNCLISGWLLTVKLTVAWNKTIKYCMVWSLVLLFSCVFVVSFLG